MSQQGYLRYPTLHRDTIVFVCDDDLWSVGASGGIARRLTAGLSEPSTPCLSADGKWIAFVSRDEQHPEVYLMESGGGPARRMAIRRDSSMSRRAASTIPKHFPQPTTRGSVTISPGCDSAMACRLFRNGGTRLQVERGVDGMHPSKATQTET